VVTAFEFLSRPNLYKGHNDYVIVGGSDVGCEIAHMIAYEWQGKVSVLEMGKHFMPKTCTSNRGYMLYHLEKVGVMLYNCCKVLSISKSHVDAEQLISKAVPNPYRSWTPILPDNIKNPFEKKLPQVATKISVPADLVVLATGAVANDQMYQSVFGQKLAKEVYAIGDAFEPGRVLEAVKAGYHLGRTL
jgi:2-enoate reductase